MNRIHEALAFQNVFAPQSVAATTDKTSDYVDMSGVDEAVFLISTAALGAGKSLTVKLLAASDSEGSDAQEIGSAKFTDAEGTAPQLAAVSYRASALHGRYVAVKFQHDGAAAVVCGVTAAADTLYLPASSGWTLVV